MKAISLHRPWADWVLLGWKKVETRTHARFRSLVHCRIAICAAKKWDDSAIFQARTWLTEEQIRLTEKRKAMPLGGCGICTVGVEYFLPTLHEAWQPDALIECRTLRTGLVLANVQPIIPPIPIIGRQGIFEVEL